jgi:amino acid transporter/nucleotide-binding universal stress UspA family protein
MGVKRKERSLEKPQPNVRKSDSQEHPEELLRELGLKEAVAIGLGTMIGAGIFVLSAIAARNAGPAAMFSYVVAGLIALPIAMTVSELATGMPKAGGSYFLISRALGPVAGAVVGPGNWLGLTFATAFYLIGFAQYLAYFIPIPTWITVLVAGLFFLFLNYRGAKLSGQLQNIIVILLVLILALFVGRGLFNIDPKLHKPFFPFGWGAVIANVGLVIVSFTGFEKISTIAEEIKQPERNLPLAIIGSVIIATILYAAILYVATGILPYQVIAGFQAPLVEAADRFMSTIGVVGMSIAALLATASSTNAAIMASSRINFAMGRDRILPEWFNEIHSRYLTPYRSILVTGVLAILLALSGQAAALAEISSALFMISYALLSLALLVMHRAKPRWYQPTFHVPLYPWLPAAGGILALAVITTMDVRSQIAGLGLVVLSLIWFVVWGSKKTQLEGELAPWWQRERPLEAVIADVEQAVETSYPEVLVPLANPATSRSLAHLAAGIARGHGRMSLAALRIMTVPLNLPLQFGQAYYNRETSGRHSLLQDAAEVGESEHIAVTPLLVAAHGVASGIASIANLRHDTQLILLGWHGPITLGRIRGSIDKEVLHSATCDVGVLMDRRLKTPRRILVPVGGGPHARLGLRLAFNLACGYDGELTALRIVTRRQEVDLQAEREALQKVVESELNDQDQHVRFNVIRSPQVVSSILNEAKQGYDLLVIGASNEWFLRNWLFGSIPDIVAERSPCSVLLVRKYEPAPLPWVRRVRHAIVEH